MPKGPQSEPTSPAASLDDVAWLNDVLFAGADSVMSPRNPRSPQSVAWAALPFRGTTRRLVPTSPRFASTAMANAHDAMSPRRRAIGRLVDAPVRGGALRLAPKLRADADLVFTDPNRSVIAAAAKAIGSDIVSCAITLGPRRYNRKPVVQLFDENAVTVGFLKVAADDATSAMVDTEAATLARLAVANRVLVVPQVLWSSSWHGRAVACLSPVSAQGPVVAARPARLIAVAAAVIEATGGRHEAPVLGSGPIARLAATAHEQNASQQLQLLSRIEQQLGDASAVLAGWHGDFSPWNMISDADSTALIDWEFSNEQMPVGADLLHNQVMVATHLRGEPVHEPLERLRAHGSNIPSLHALDIAPARHQTHLLLYLLELVRRDLELIGGGRAVTGFGDPAMAIAVKILDDLNTHEH